MLPELKTIAMLKLQGLDHLTLTVGDLSRSLHFYKDVPGFEENDGEGSPWPVLDLTTCRSDSIFLLLGLGRARPREEDHAGSPPATTWTTCPMDSLGTQRLTPSTPTGSLSSNYNVGIM